MISLDRRGGKWGERVRKGGEYDLFFCLLVSLSM